MIDSQLLRYNIKDKKIVSIDTETNGLNYVTTRPFSLAFNVYEGYNLIESHDIHIKYPDYKIDGKLAVKVHYNKEKVEKVGVEPKQAFDLLKKYTNNKDYIFVGSNYLGYDCMIIKNSAEEAGVDIGYDYLSRVYDTNALFKSLKLGIKPDNENLLAFQISMNELKVKGLKSRLGVVCEYFNVPYIEEEAHSALYDVTRSYLTFMEIIKKIEII